MVVNAVIPKLTAHDSAKRYNILIHVGFSMTILKMPLYMSNVD